MTERRRAGACATALAIAALGCGPRQLGAGPDEPGACVPAGAWMDVSTRTVLTPDAVVARALAHRIVLLGEEHDVMEQHRWQTYVVSALHASGRPLVLGFEAFDADAQPILDRWRHGALDTDAFLEQTRWRETWTFPADLYLPLFHLGRMLRLPMVALNVDRDVVRAVGRSGWDAVSPAERDGVGQPAPAGAAYRARLAGTWADHACRPAEEAEDDPAFERFVWAQLTWDRAMAEALARSAEAHPEAVVVGIVGRGHTEQPGGIPAQLEALGAPAPLVLLAWDGERPCDELTTAGAAMVFGTTPLASEHRPPPPSPCEHDADQRPPR